MLLYGAAIALSAFLLFEVQPVIAKMILPWFGGSAAVWTTALMFFQIALLAGYVYSYLSIRYLKPKAQALLHVMLLAASLALLPILPSSSWRTTASGDPTMRILLLLLATVGLPYFMLSSTSPLLQAWYAAERPGTIPYRLFAVSNAGSMLALISFPIAIEPFLASRVQAIAWSWAYAAFATLCAAVAIGAGKIAPAVSEPAFETTNEPAPSWRLQILWTALPACASALLLAITNHLTQNVAPIPFLWVLTLALYLMSFILCFESDRTYNRGVFLPLFAMALAGMALGLYANAGNLGITLAVPLYSGGLFVCCMVCHGELARLKPHPRYLTRYYLTLALGGAIGGLFVAVASPHLFDSYLELPLSMIACAALALALIWNGLPRVRLRISAGFFVGVLTGGLVYGYIQNQAGAIANVRNFYGALRVTEQLANDESTAMRKLVNGTIIHGAQLEEPGRRREPTTYYGPSSGIARALALEQKQGPVRVGVVGLGAGVLASYCRPGDAFRFYEINPLDVAVANRYFTFLKDCPDCKVSIGDARLVMESEPPQPYDLLAVDAFSSDAIPIHLLTREAFALYLRRLKPDGILAIHVSNRYLDLIPVVARDAEEFQYRAYQITDRPSDDYLSASTWMLIGRDTHMFVLLGFEGGAILECHAPRTLRTWTDDFSNLYQIVRW